MLRRSGDRQTTHCERIYTHSMPLSPEARNCKLVRLQEPGANEAGQVLTRAFQEDPFQSYIIPDPDERQSLSPAFFSELLRYGFLAGEVWSADKPIRGLTVYLPPSERLANPDLLREAGFDRLVAVIGEDAFGRFTSFLDYIAPL